MAEFMGELSDPDLDLSWDDIVFFFGADLHLTGACYINAGNFRK